MLEECVFLMDEDDATGEMSANKLIELLQRELAALPESARETAYVRIGSPGSGAQLVLHTVSDECPASASK